MAVPRWFYGICFSMLASFSGSLGKILMRYSHIRSQAFKATNSSTSSSSAGTYDKEQCRSLLIWVFALFCMVVLNAGCGVIAFSFAAASMLAPFGGLFPP